MSIHKLLARQLSRFGFTTENKPENLEQWKEFLERINNAYAELDQERYLLERSMDISSRELLELNAKLENSQHIARLGYWLYDPLTDKIFWSKELASILKFGAQNPTPNFQEFLMLMDEASRENLRQSVKKAFDQKKDFECEIYLKNADPDSPKWFYIMGRPVPAEGQNGFILSSVAMDITRRKMAEEEISELHKQLIASARRAGMAEVATSVLHNIGNILNSSNVSVGLLQENTTQSNTKKLMAISEMIKENLPQIGDYLSKDPKGKLIPEYLIALADVLVSENQVVTQEIHNLAEQIQHIKEIVAMQKTISGLSSGIQEKIFLPEIIDTALNISGNNALESKNIHVYKDYKETPFITVDKSKLLQIMINLVQNAKDALLEQPEGKERKICLEINKDGENQIKVTVKDTGSGIEEENLLKIFSLGFTTKPSGHGFGLHSSALAAKEIGGKLEAESLGKNKGAAFILTLPLN